MRTLSRGATYIPALGLQYEDAWIKNLNQRGFDFTWFSDKAFFKYPYMLTNAYYGIERGYQDYRKRFKYPDDHILVGDSGGFQIAQYSKKGKDIKINPVDILRWLESNSDIGMNLDIPPVISYKDSLKRSVKNFKIFKDNRQNYNFKLYNILHGNNLQEIERWYKVVHRYPFDGWAIGIKPSTNTFLQLLCYLILIQKGESSIKDWCHVFGVSGLQNMLSLSIASEHFDSKITFDSSSYNMGSRFRMYYIPWNVRYIIDFGRNATNHLDRLPCKCPVCLNSDPSIMYDQQDPRTPFLISIHNLYHFMEVNNIINVLAKDHEALDCYADSLGELEFVKIVRRFLKDFDDHNYQYVYEKYKQLFVMDKYTKEGLSLCRY